MRPISGPPGFPALLRLRSVGNLVNLSTPAGLAVAALGRARVRRLSGGLFLGEHYRLGFPRAGAFTIGNVILTGGSWDDLERRFPHLLAHEERHTWQYLYCLGLPYLVLYSAAMGWSAIRTGDRSSANFFERQANLGHGGYVELPTRPLIHGVLRLLRRPS